MEWFVDADFTKILTILEKYKKPVKHVYDYPQSKETNLMFKAQINLNPHAQTLIHTLKGCAASH